MCYRYGRCILAFHWVPTQINGMSSCGYIKVGQCALIHSKGLRALQPFLLTSFSFIWRCYSGCKCKQDGRLKVSKNLGLSNQQHSLVIAKLTVVAQTSVVTIAVVVVVVVVVVGYQLVASFLIYILCTCEILLRWRQCGDGGACITYMVQEIIF